MSATAILSALNAPLATGKAVSGEAGAADGAFTDLLAAETTDAATTAAPIAPVVVRPPTLPVPTDTSADVEADAGSADAETGLEIALPTFPQPAVVPVPTAVNAASDIVPDAEAPRGGLVTAPPVPAETAPVPEQPPSGAFVPADKATKASAPAPSNVADTPEAPVAAAKAEATQVVAKVDQAVPAARELIAETGADIVKAALASAGPLLAPARMTALRAPTTDNVVIEIPTDGAPTTETPDAPTAARPDGSLPFASTPAAPAPGLSQVKPAEAQVTNALVAPEADASPDGPAAPSGTAPSPTAQPASPPVAAGPTVAPSPVLEPIVTPASFPPEISATGNIPTADTSASTPAVVETSLSSLSRATIETTAQLAAQITRRLEGRSTRFEMALTPEGLGRVDVSLDIDADGQLAARLAFDNPLAATDMRGRADELRRQLEDAGFTLARDALEFSGRDGSSGGGQAFDRRQGRAAAYATRNAAVEAEALTTPAPWTNPNQTPRGVDVKV